MPTAVDLAGLGYDLETQSGLFALLDLSGDRDDGLPGELRHEFEQGGFDLLLGKGDLHGAVPVPQDEERDAAHVPDVLDPSFDGGLAVRHGYVA